MNMITKYFYGKYLKYWYVSFVVIIFIMVMNSYAKRNVGQFDLIVFDSHGLQKSFEIVDAEDVFSFEKNINILTTSLPRLKAFIPQKRLNPNS